MPAALAAFAGIITVNPASVVSNAARAGLTTIVPAAAVGTGRGSEPAPLGPDYGPNPPGSGPYRGPTPTAVRTRPPSDPTGVRTRRGPDPPGVSGNRTVHPSDSPGWPMVAPLRVAVSQSGTMSSETPRVAGRHLSLGRRTRDVGDRRLRRGPNAAAAARARHAPRGERTACRPVALLRSRRASRGISRLDGASRATAIARFQGRRPGRLCVGAGPRNGRRGGLRAVHDGGRGAGRAAPRHLRRRQPEPAWPRAEPTSAPWVGRSDASGRGTPRHPSHRRPRPLRVSSVQARVRA